MEYTTLINLVWDLATGVSAGLIAYGAWLCLEYRFELDDLEATKPDAVRMTAMLN